MAKHLSLDKVSNALGLLDAANDKLRLYSGRVDLETGSIPKEFDARNFNPKKALEALMEFSCRMAAAKTIAAKMSRLNCPQELRNVFESTMRNYSDLYENYVAFIGTALKLAEES